MAESYVRTAVEIGKMNDVGFFSRYGGNVAALLDCFAARTADEVGQAAYDLLTRHAANVIQVLSSAVTRYSSDLIEHRLPASCVTVMSVSQGTSESDGAPGPAGFGDEQEAVQLPQTHKPLPLQLALDEKTQDVIVRGLMRIAGADSRLVRALEVTHRKDMLDGRAPENYRFTTPEKLADDLDYDDEVAIRQRVSTCRAEIKEMFQEVHGFPLPKNALIETSRPFGYRLNPYIRFIAISDLSTASAPSHRTKNSVTNRSEAV
jgi:hypothetical protein